MPEYIEREEALKVIILLDWANALFAGQKILNIPAADVAPVVHGRWIPVDGGQHKCSRCHTVRKTDVARDHYCPNCWAKMDGRKPQMRQILFRGKRIDNGDWVYGLLCQYHEGISAKIALNDFGVFDIGMAYCVEPSTIGQYTCLTDKNGARIFEGDIAEFDAYESHYQGVVTVIDGNSCILCGEKAAPFLDHALEHYKATVIGNIHDNPELMEDAHDL